MIERTLTLGIPIAVWLAIRPFLGIEPVTELLFFALTGRFL
jgi:hypothetical protein